MNDSLEAILYINDYDSIIGISPDYAELIGNIT